MALQAAQGLSTAHKNRLKRFDPVMDDANGIPAAIAHKDDVDNVITDLASTANAKGASQIGIEDSGTLITATTVEGALAENRTAVNANTNARVAASTDVGLLHHVEIVCAGGSTANYDKALAAGTWKVVDFYTVVKGAGTVSDTIQLAKDTGGNITDAIDISASVDTDRVPCAKLDDANQTLTGGTDALRVVQTDGGGSDCPPVDAHVVLRKIA